MKSANAIDPIENIVLWTDKAPGETTKEAGTTLPSRKTDNPLITRVEKISIPLLMYSQLLNQMGNSAHPTRGGFRYVVTDLEDPGGKMAKRPWNHGICFTVSTSEIGAGMETSTAG